MPNRVLISRDSKPISCEECGLPALHVARLVAGDGTLLGQTMVCTACRRHRSEAAAEAVAVP
ncbi:hypothetical protein QRX60_35560 [Amycolatopsis mongoliensis]|uniref:Uncharacterized protein n=1 Tax=Amycolatopsis mongoliensis TaxID=715475 RepID=A0A9Y2NF38_9PSEU|nr:hypothetical protein [Amycolatopsis sp. 4-36]WIX99338.1 hypothetical protein QRX60_35560 [Amycolatopsis sp. 4-36]